MYLIIDNSGANKVKLNCFLNTQWLGGEFAILKKRGLLAGMVNFLSAHKKKLEDVRGLGVVVGVGCFTATRIAVTVANVLAYAFRIPVVGLESADSLAKAVKKIKSAPVGRYVSASYSGQPNIGRPKI